MVLGEDTNDLDLIFGILIFDNFPDRRYIHLYSRPFLLRPRSLSNELSDFLEVRPSRKPLLH
jgi:hypothetical protein